MTLPARCASTSQNRHRDRTVRLAQALGDKRGALYTGYRQYRDGHGLTSGGSGNGRSGG